MKTLNGLIATLKLHVCTKRFNWQFEALEFASNVNSMPDGFAIAVDNNGWWSVFYTFNERARPIVPILAERERDGKYRNVGTKHDQQIHREAMNEGRAVKRSFRSIVARAKLYHDD